MNAIGSLSRRRASQDDFADPGLDALLELEAAARVLDLEDWIEERLRHAEYEEAHTLLVRKDNGQALTVPVLHVEHSTAAGIASGPLNLTSDSFPGSLRAAAMQASWQHALLGLPFGGGATALSCDPRALAERELQRVAGEFAKLAHGRRHLAYPGVGMNQCIAGWMHGASSCMVCGIPESAGGVAQNTISALVLMEVIRYRCAQRGERLVRRQVAIQGFDGAGMGLASMLYRAGALVVALADVSGGISDPLGLNVDAVRAHVEREGVLLGYPEGKPITNADVLLSACDVLVLADRTGQISESSVSDVKAGLVIEFTPGALHNSAVRALTERNIQIVPAILGGAGAALAAFIEHSQRESTHWSKPRIAAFVRRVVRRACDEVAAGTARWGLSEQCAAVTVGVQKVAAAIRANGF